ncbi:F-box/LRR-repeat protein At3g03360-like [Eucalyptus grandis]|uniref:F-box/LRR-repeat protein At3g03360-like n=1 Tax=Eucalyptus grandis TaxID=71139 RepID=UPI00192E8981|nr:F-box/LRR-repeat protein At3g03360-like [Eucalyptus grandis]
MAESSKRRRILLSPESSRDRPPPPSSPRDLISALPDHAIRDIFSHLPIEDVVRTSVLSKRWRYRWRTVTTNLVFNRVRPHHRRTRSLDFRCIVDSVLSQHTSTLALKKFHVNGFCCYDEADSPKLKEWLRFAEQRHVEDLRLEVDSLECMFILPQFLFCLSSLVRLQVSRCRFSLGATSINLPRLKVLSMSNVNLSDNILASILKGSPVLESLELGRCVDLNNIIINSTSVKHLFLSITNFFDLRRIRAPHLLRLRIAGTCSCSKGAEHMSLEDISSLVEADLNFEILPRVHGDNRMACDLLKKFLERLPRVSTIIIGDWCLQFQLGEESNEDFNLDEEVFLCSQKENFGCLSKHLKRVEIICFGACSSWSKHLLTLIKFLLGYALVLEKLIIKVKLPTRVHELPATVLSQLLDLSTDVLSFRRALENAKVIFYYPLE